MTVMTLMAYQFRTPWRRCRNGSNRADMRTANQAVTQTFQYVDGSAWAQPAVKRNLEGNIDMDSNTPAKAISLTARSTMAKKTTPIR